MNKHSNLVTGASLLFSALGFGILANLPASAQSSYPSADTATPIEMSKEGMMILCDRTPLNSRCAGSPYATSPSQNSTDTPGQADTTTAPTENLPSESPVPAPGELRQTSPRISSPDQNNRMSSPSQTTSPTENLPSESDVPSPREGNGMNSEPSLPQPSGDMNAPDSGTTAPTENLPSESSPPSSK
jgi:hypothetical protein